MTNPIYRPTHYIGANKVTRLPTTHIVFDTETRRTIHGDYEDQFFRCAVACEWHRHDASRQWTKPRWGQFTEVVAFWDWLEASCRPRHRTVAVAHNLGFDLRVLDAFTVLPERGWELQVARIDRGASFVNWRKGNRSLVFCDSTTWAGVPLATIAETFGYRKRELPSSTDNMATWLRRCHRDTDILRMFWQAVMDWIESDDLGNWKPTGAGQAWAAWRHRFMTDRVLVHDNEAARLAERAAAWTGRCEVWKHGVLDNGPYIEWDFKAAYAHIGADSLVPVRLRGRVEHPQLRQWRDLSTRNRVLSVCTVTTEAPTVPCKGPSGILWPVGTFRTVLWENELSLAIAHGAKIEIDHAWVYFPRPALSEFCTWVLAQLDEDNTDVPAWRKLVLKGWSRSLIGRFAARWPTFVAMDDAPDNQVRVLNWLDQGATEATTVLQLGRKLLRETDITDSPDCAPAIMSWVMAEARCRLWKAMVGVGHKHVVYVDTDSLITDMEGSERMERLAIPGMRMKGRWDSVDLRGPRQLVLGDHLRAAGVSSKSVRTADGRWRGEAFEQLRTALEGGRPDRVRVKLRTVSVDGRDNRRAHGRAHSTAAFRVHLSPDGLTNLLG